MKRTITFINVGYGEAILLRDPQADVNILIDGGSGEAAEYEGASSGRIRACEYLERAGIDHLDLAVATHIHEDHLCGLVPVLERLKPREFWHTLPENFAEEAMRRIDPALAQNPSQDKFIHALNDYVGLCALLKDSGCRMRSVCAGDTAQFGDALSLTVLSPDEGRCGQLAQALREVYSADGEAELLARLSKIDAAMNNFSLILSVAFGGARLLLPGDTNRDGYGGLPAEALRADLFKVGHHGQKDGAGEALIQMVRPRAVVCCASSDRRYNSADPALIAMIEAHGARMYYSDCPDGRAPKHSALVFGIGPGGELEGRYEE